MLDQSAMLSAVKFILFANTMLTTPEQRLESMKQKVLLIRNLNNSVLLLITIYN